MLSIAITALASPRPVMTHENPFAALSDADLERQWEACHSLMDGVRLIRKDAVIELGLLAADLSHERIRRLMVRAEATCAAS
jgi:hypothetical protein